MRVCVCVCVCYVVSQLTPCQDTVLFEERILCFTRLQRFEDALNVIYRHLKSYNKATAYCAKYQGDAETNLFLVLLKARLTARPAFAAR